MNAHREAFAARDVRDGRGTAPLDAGAADAVGVEPVAEGELSTEDAGRLSDRGTEEAAFGLVPVSCGRASDAGEPRSSSSYLGAC